MERVAFRAGRCQVGSVTGLTESGSVRSSILDTLDTPLTPPPVCEFVSMLCLSADCTLRDVLVLGALAVV